MKQSQFEKNGGYFIDGVPYMDCKITGEPVKNVSTDCKEVIGSSYQLDHFTKCFLNQTNHLINLLEDQKAYHWMKEFVDKDGTVYHLGKEQPKVERYITTN